MTNVCSPRPLSVSPIMPADLFIFFAKQRNAEVWKQFISVTRILKATNHLQYVSRHQEQEIDPSFLTLLIPNTWTEGTKHIHLGSLKLHLPWT